jgi:hypothetical protein
MILIMKCIIMVFIIIIVVLVDLVAAVVVVSPPPCDAWTSSPPADSALGTWAVEARSVVRVLGHH